ncbi:hypothetical protein D3C85_1780640 [compost metagenome]
MRMRQKLKINKISTQFRKKEVNTNTNNKKAKHQKLLKARKGFMLVFLLKFFRFHHQKIPFFQLNNGNNPLFLVGLA